MPTPEQIQTLARQTAERFMNETLRTIGALDRLIAAALTTVSADTRKAILATANCGVAGHFRFQENGGICMMCQREHQIKTAAERTASQLAVVNERVVDRLVEEKRQLRVENNAQYLARVAAESQLAEVTKERNKSKADRQRWVDSWHFDTERLTAERDAALADAASARTAMSDAIRRETRLRDAVKCEIADLDDIIIGIDIQHPVTRESIQRQMQRLNAALSHQPKGGESNMQEFHTDLGGSMTPQPGKPVIADGPIPLASQAHNPDNLSQEQVGVADGWRLLDVDEVKNVPEVFLRDIQLWLGTKWDGTKWRGAGVGDTYRTRLSRVELRKARGLPDSCDVCGGKNGKHLKSCSINYIPRPVESGSDDARYSMIQPGDHLRQDDEEVLANNQWGKIKPKYWGDKVALIDCFRRPKVAATAQPETPTHAPMAWETFVLLKKALEVQCEATAKAQTDRDEARASFETQRNNYTRLYNAVMGGDTVTSDFVNPWEVADNLHAEIATLRAQVAEAHWQRDAVWSKTCVHHTDAERAAITRPVCALAELRRAKEDSARLDWIDLHGAPESTGNTRDIRAAIDAARKESE